MSRALATIETSGTGHEIFRSRATRAVEGLLANLDRTSLHEAASAPTDIEVLFIALQQPAVLHSMLDPLAPAKLLGQLRRKELLEAEGGVVGPEQLGNVLGIRRQSVDKTAQGRDSSVELGRMTPFPPRFPIMVDCTWVRETWRLQELQAVLCVLKCKLLISSDYVCYCLHSGRPATDRWQDTCACAHQEI